MEVGVDGDEVGALDADTDERDDPVVPQLGDDVHLPEEIIRRHGRRLDNLIATGCALARLPLYTLLCAPFPIRFSARTGGGISG